MLTTSVPVVSPAAITMSPCVVEIVISVSVASESVAVNVTDISSSVTSEAERIKLVSSLCPSKIVTVPSPL